MAERTICQQAAELVRERAPDPAAAGNWDRQDCLRIVAVWDGAREARSLHDVRGWMLRATTDLIGGVEAALLEFAPGRGLRVVERRGVEQLGWRMARHSGGIDTGRLASAGDGMATFTGLPEADPSGEISEGEERLLAAVPIRDGQRVLGVLAVYAALESRNLEDSDHAVLLAIGRHGGLLLSRLEAGGGEGRAEGAVSVA
ncbi:MAG: hypothetical protein M3N43_09100 [Actinomycetota bacterium]|nr:hypothetical protein [Actinomycetota bacterium]